ncbi:L-threonylcarbamoyladenylate synthase [Phormidium sp. LEGE 05292]|uniref:L-threonylcarbamoyladenylate synthase n=1 Tax=[Phormidium] sp. LEGE 05292 TaxID=767427 RepID=UPI001883064D|nr:L-threonylcarbamoyladenylate synthase [Phormidium sp. LEGE 05292]MBE9229193.1 L-threonylcarbamoyladenylate synthase [Phormidium sp. LEGE 05292]
MKVSIDVLVAKAKSGSVVSFPTDTVPALAANPEKSHLIFEVKQRSQDKPLILMAATAEELWPFCLGNIAEFRTWQQVADRYWPGALTLVLPASDKVPIEVNPLDPTTIGVRVPNSSIARQILAQTGPLATTSANLSGQPPLETMAEIEAQFPEVVTLLWEEELKNQAGGIPSTVAKWTDKGWQILRQGAIKLV